MTGHESDRDRLVALSALIVACNACLRVSLDCNGTESDCEHYLIPRGLWDNIVRATGAS